MRQQQPLSGLPVYRRLYVLSRSRPSDPSVGGSAKTAAHDFTHELLTRLEVDDPAMVAKQMELVLEGCLSRMLVNRSQADVDTAHRLAEDILRFAQCRMGGALT
jgi:hypothetical protein